MKKNKSILITGSSNGIGAGIARHFGKLGYSVAVTYKENRDDANDVALEIEKTGGCVKLYRLDVTDEESVKEVFVNVGKDFGKLDVLVNNAAVDFPTPIETVSFNEWKEITRTKIDGNFLCTKYAIPYLKKSSNANLIIIMSNMHEKVDPDDPAYCVGTGGTVAFMKSMALALVKYGIRTNGIGPSETKTNSKYWKQFGTDKLWKEISEKNPMGRLCTPEDVANTIQMVVDDKTKFLNGNLIFIDGGNHLK